LHAARTSSLKIFGCSHAAKWQPSGALKRAGSNDALQGHNCEHSDPLLLDTYCATTQNS